MSLYSNVLMEPVSDHHKHTYLFGVIHSYSHLWFKEYVVSSVPPARRARPSVPIPVCHDHLVSRWPRGENQQGEAGRCGEHMPWGSGVRVNGADCKTGAQRHMNESHEGQRSTLAAMKTQEKVNLWRHKQAAMGGEPSALSWPPSSGIPLSAP